MTDYFYLLIMAAAEKKEVQGVNFEELVDRFARLTLCKKGCYTHLYNIVIQVVIQYLLYTLRIIVYNCV